MRVPKLDPLHFGEAYVLPSSDIPEGTALELTIDDQRVVKPIPFRSFRLPVGSYTATFKNTEFGINQKVRFVIREGKRTKIDFE